MNGIHSLADEYVVGALSTTESLEFETHLRECSHCREEVAQMQQITAELSASVAAAPPPSLRTSILNTIAETPQESQFGRERPTETEANGTASPSFPQQGEGGRNTTPLSQSSEPVAAVSSSGNDRPDALGQSDQPVGSNVVPMRRRTTMATSLLAAAAVLAALGIGGWALQSRESAQDATAQTQQITRLLGAPDVRTVSGTFANGGAGTVVLSRAQKSAILVASGLPELSDDEVYEAWAMTPDPVAAGTFTSDGSNAVLDLPDSTLNAAQVAVTVEPKGGSTQPTSDALFAVKLPRA